MPAILDFTDEEPSPAPAGPSATNRLQSESFESARRVTVSKLPAEPVTDRQPRPTTHSGRNGSHAANGAAMPMRELPHSIEDEEALLASLLIDAVDVLAKCQEGAITGSSFYEPNNATVFECIRDLVAAGSPVDPSTVASALRALNKLERMGGYAFITQISSRSPTTLQTSFFIDKVRSFAARRELIRVAHETIEEAQRFSSDDLTSLTDGVQRKLARIAESGSADPAASIMARAFDPGKLIPKPGPIYSVNEVVICTPGNLTTIYSQAKTGKSSFLAAMVSSTMTQPGAGHDTLGVSGPNYGMGAVVHFDTEQSPYDWQQLIRSALRRVGLESPPPWLMSFTLAGMEAGKAERFVHHALRLARKTHGSIHSVFIDGVADLVNDPNSPDECFPLVARLHGAAIEYNTAIVNILHLNPAARDKADKGRGHLGSQLERKCESNLTLKKTGDVTTVIGEGRQRGKPLVAGKAPSFQWSDEHMMHRSCTTPVSEDLSPRKAGRPELFRFEDYRCLIPKKSEPGSLIGPLARAFSVNRPVKVNQLCGILDRWVEDGLVEVSSREQGKCYRLAI